MKPLMRTACMDDDDSFDSNDFCLSDVIYLQLQQSVCVFESQNCGTMKYLRS